MFNNVGWAELIVICAVGLIILGPERLPGAIQWSIQSLRRVKEYAGGASEQLKGEFGEDFDDLRKPLSQLNELRGMTPKAAVTRHLLDGDTSVFDAFTGLPGDIERATGRTANGKPAVGKSAGGNGAGDTSGAGTPIKPVSTPLPAEQLAGTDGGTDGDQSAAPRQEPSAGKRPSVADWDAT